MKNAKWMLSLVLMAISAMAVAQTEKKHAIKLDMVGVFNDKYQLAYEVKVGEHSSFLMNVGTYLRLQESTSQSGNGSTISSKDKKTGFSLQPEYRVYFGNDRFPQGFYVNFFGSIDSYKREDQSTGVVGYEYHENNRDFFEAGLGTGLGFQWMLQPGFVVEMNLGPKFSYTKSSYVNSYYQNTWNGEDQWELVTSEYKEEEIAPKLFVGINFGYSF